MNHPIQLTCRIFCRGTAWLVLTSFAFAADGYGKVELVRDRWGVPHVFAETDAGATYGLGYATAEDRGFHRAAEELVGHLDEGSVGLLHAYCDGVNDYFRRNGDKLHGLYEKVGLEPEPWTPADCILSWWHLAQFFATDGTRDLLRYRNLTEGRAEMRRAVPGRGGRGAPGRVPPLFYLLGAPAPTSSFVAELHKQHGASRVGL